MKEQMISRVPMDLKKDIKRISEFEGTTMNGFVNYELRKVVDRKKKQYGFDNRPKQPI